MKGCVKQFASYRKFDHHVIEILKNKIWEDTEKVRKWQGEGEAPYDQGHDRGRGVQVVIFVINFQLRLQLFNWILLLGFSWVRVERGDATTWLGLYQEYQWYLFLGGLGILHWANFLFQLAQHDGNLAAYPIRLKPGQEMKSALMDFVKDNNLRAPFILTCCGSVTKATLRWSLKWMLNPNAIYLALITF